MDPVPAASNRWEIVEEPPTFLANQR